MKFDVDFKPALFQSLRNYSKEKFFKDLMAGIIVGIVALPLAIAFGIASGVSPEKGMITAIIGGFIVSFFGGSSVQIGGPTGAFIVIVYGIIQNFGVEGLAIATVIAGVLLLLMGALKLGSVIRFIPYPIIVGFTSGIATTIFSTQIKDLFGLTMDEVPAEFISKWGAYFKSFNTVNIWSMIIGLGSVAVIALTPKVSKRVPGSLIAIVFMTIAAYILKNYCGILSIETIGDRYAIASSLPKPAGFTFNIETLHQLISPAITIAILGAIESLLSATVADGVIGEKHNSNSELIAQGAANIVVPFFGGIPVTGAIARTMTNINNGGVTPVAGLIHAVVLLLILICLGPLTQHIPMACLAGVLVIVSYNMSEWRTIRNLLKSPRTDVVVLFVTLLLTVIFDLTIAIEVGMLLAMLLFMRRVAGTSNISIEHERISLDSESLGDSGSSKTIELHKGIDVYEVDGPFFFGIANKFEEIMRVVDKRPTVRIIRMRKVPFIDSTGLHNLEMLIKSSQSDNIQIILSGVRPEVRESLLNMGIDKLIGSDNIFDHIDKAAKKANEIAESL